MNIYRPHVAVRFDMDRHRCAIIIAKSFAELVSVHSLLLRFHVPMIVKAATNMETLVHQLPFERRA